MKMSPSKIHQNSVSIKLKTNESMEKIKNGCPEYVHAVMIPSFHELYCIRALRTMRINKLPALPQCR